MKHMLSPKHLIALFGTSLILLGTSSLKADENAERPARGQGQRQRQGNGQGQEIRKKFQEFRQQQRKAFKEHMETQKKENQALRESLKDEDDKASKLKEHFTTQHKENVAFMEKQHKTRLEFINANAPEQLKQKMIDKATEIYDKLKAHLAEQYKENETFFASLEGKDLKPQEKKKLVMEHFKKQREENREFRQGLHGERQRGNRDGQRQAGKRQRRPMGKGDNAKKDQGLGQGVGTL